MVQKILHGESLGNQKDHSVTLSNVRFEHRQGALGIGTVEPRLSWIVETQAKGWWQSSYAIEAYDPGGELRDQTGQVESDQSLLLPWPFAPPQSGERRTTRVRV